MKLSDYIHKSRKINKDKHLKNIKIAFLSNFTITGISKVMKVLCFKQKIYADIYTSPYNQYAQEILNKSSKLNNFNSNIIFILLDAEQLLGDFCYFPYKKDKKQRKEFIQEKFNELKDLINILRQNTNAKIVITSDGNYRGDKIILVCFYCQHLV